MQTHSESRRRLERLGAMTVADLIEELKQYDGDALVVFGADYGDMGHTEQALPVQSVDMIADEELERCEGYSRSGVAIVKSNDDESHRDDVIVLR